jgi:hypothetical protein
VGGRRQSRFLCRALPDHPRVRTQYPQWPGSPGEGRRQGGRRGPGWLPGQAARRSRRPSPGDREAAGGCGY